MMKDTREDAFQIEWYKLHRAHELELNKASLAYEHERLKFLVYVNGGAIGGLLTLLGATWKNGAVLYGAWTHPAALCWVAGLGLAWFAWSEAHRGQSDLTRAYRMRRYAEELRVRGTAGLGIQEHHASSDQPVGHPTSAGLDLAADSWRGTGGDRVDRAWRAASISFLCFLVGAVFTALGLSKMAY
jgi:hypothetical protein